ncbi:MAG: PAS domain-containing protein [Methylomonas sp.]|jgi:PAS domain S-box-containing protein
MSFQIPYSPTPAPDLYSLPIMPLVLIVAIDFELHQLIAESLEKHNFRAVAAKSGHEGIRQAVMLKPDLALLDFDLPDMEAHEVCRRLKADVDTESIPVIFMIASDATDKLPDGFAAGGEDYLCKPLNLNEFLVRIKLCLNLYGSRFKRKTKKSGWSWLGGQALNMPAYLELPIEEQRLSVKFLSDSLSSAPKERLSKEQNLLHELHVYQLKLEKQNEALRESRVTAEMALERYTELFDFAPTAYFILGRDSLIYQTNFRGSHLLSRERFKIIGQYFVNYVINTDRQIFMDFLENVFAATHKQSNELCLKINGKIHWVNIDASIADSSLRTCVVDVTDISEQKRIEAEKQSLLDILENSPDAIVRYDRDFRRIYVNRAYLGLTETGLIMAINKTPREYWSMLSPDADTYMELLNTIIDTGNMVTLQAQRLDKNGQTIYLAIYLVPEFDQYGKVNSILSISRDITELKATECRLEESRAQLRALSAQREETREDERKRIAREMHDELGQRLTALRLDIARLRLRFGKDNPELFHQVKEMLLAVDATIQVVRNVAADLRPAVLDMGINHALEWLVADFCKRSGIYCDLQIFSSDDFAWDDSHATAIFRIVQESLTNVARHSEADKVWVILERLESEYQLQIIDNGKGFDLTGGPKRGSFGLIGIEERVLLLGGKLIVETGLGKGVKIRVRFSIQQKR